MMNSMIKIGRDGLVLTLCPPDPDNGYYRGTRFDHSGVFRKVEVGGYVIADEWFDEYGPYKHDAVCGYSEEFAEAGYESASIGGVFLKPGVGLLIKEDEQPYDHFRLYKVADAGRWTVEVEEDKVVFVHVVEGDRWGYEYTKTVRVVDGGSFEISHELKNIGERRLTGDTYNHNFNTFSQNRPGPAINIDFTFHPCGTWRSEYDSVGLTENGIRFSRPIKQGESVFMGNLKPVDGSPVIGRVYTQSAEGHSVTFHADKAFHRIAFWANHRVACIEPFIPYDIMPGDEFIWNYRYELR